MYLVLQIEHVCGRLWPRVGGVEPLVQLNGMEKTSEGTSQRAWASRAPEDTPVGVRGRALDNFDNVMLERRKCDGRKV